MYGVAAATSSGGGVRSIVVGNVMAARSCPRHGRQKSSRAQTSTVASPSRNPAAVGSSVSGSSTFGIGAPSYRVIATDLPP